MSIVIEALECIAVLGVLLTLFMLPIWAVDAYVKYGHRLGWHRAKTDGPTWHDRIIGDDDPLG